MPTPLPAVLFFPNPVSDLLKVTINRPLHPGATLLLYDVYGRKIHTAALPEVGAWLEIPVAQWPAGAYFYAVYDRGKVVRSGKVLKR